MLYRAASTAQCPKCGQQISLTTAAKLRAQDSLGVLCCCLGCGHDWIHHDQSGSQRNPDPPQAPGGYARPREEFPSINLLAE